jgi:hypothetical protein
MPLIHEQFTKIACLVLEKGKNPTASVKLDKDTEIQYTSFIDTEKNGIPNNDGVNQDIIVYQGPWTEDIRNSYKSLQP